MSDGTVLVVGASGLAGRACLAAFGRRGRAVGTFATRPAPGLLHLDVRVSGEVASLMDAVAPRVVVCAGADPHVEGCEIDPAGTRRVNVEGTLRLAEAAQAVGAGFVFFSSEYVFDGKAGPYAEEAPRHALNEYGRQKAECEEALPSIVARSLVVRTSGIFGWHEAGKNFVMQLIAKIGRGEPMRVPDDQVITPTYAPNLAEVTADLVEQGVSGIVHVAGSRPVTRVEFARLAAQTYGLPLDLVEPTPTAAFGLKAVRPRSAGLKTDKAASLARTPLLDPAAALTAMRDAGAGSRG